MKQAIGSILCLLAALRIVGLFIISKPDTTAHRVQDWAMVGVMLAIGIPLSASKKKSDTPDKNP